MPIAPLSRRQLLAASALAPLAGVASSQAHDAVAAAATPVRFCLNTSTVRGQNLSVPEQIKVAAEAGYDGIEPWLRDIDAYVESGGTLAELKSQLDDAGLRVESAIGFAKWSVNDDAERAEGLKTMRKDMQTLAAIGGTRIAAPPIGMHTPDAPSLVLDDAAERYAAILTLGRELGVTPQLEIWGFSKNLSKLAEVMYVATAAADDSVRILPDIYHLHRGGNSFDSLGMLPGTAVECFHLNDVAFTKPAAEMNDADRVYPGEGDAPIAACLRTLAASGFAGALSLELFNRDYWEQPAAAVARRGLESMRTVAAEAGLPLA